MDFQGHVENGMVVLDQPLPLADGTPVRVEPISPVPADFWQSCFLDELASRQGVSVPKDFDEMLGGWPVDELNDGFEDAVVCWREQELEQGR